MTEPSPAELGRRLDNLDSRVDAGFRDVGIRLDKMPTNDLLLAYLAKTDAEVSGLKEDIAGVQNDLAGFKKSIADAKRWAVGSVLAAGSLFVAALGLIRSFVS